MKALVTTGLGVHKAGRPILQAPDLRVEPGERVAIVGSNGSGKTTLLRVLAGLEHLHSGSVERGVSMAEMTFVHQQPWLFRGSVLDNVAYGLKARGVASAERLVKAGAWLERLGIAALAQRSVEGLSAGERRRAALARSLAIAPRLLLLDEPLGDLDQAGIEAISLALATYPEMSVLIATPAELPRGLMGRTVELMPPASDD